MKACGLVDTRKRDGVREGGRLRAGKITHS
jgi:hypothetical protein